MKKILKLTNMAYLAYLGLLMMGVVSMLSILFVKDMFITLFANNKKKVLEKSKTIQRRRKSTKYIITNYSQPAL